MILLNSKADEARYRRQALGKAAYQGPYPNLRVIFHFPRFMYWSVSHACFLEVLEMSSHAFPRKTKEIMIQGSKMAKAHNRGQRVCYYENSMLSSDPNSEPFRRVVRMDLPLDHGTRYSSLKDMILM